jgi:hypothetical protein
MHGEELSPDIAKDLHIFRHDAEIVRWLGRRWEWKYAPLTLGLLAGFVVVYLGELAFVGLSISPTYFASLTLPLGAILLTLTGAFVLPLARSMQAEDEDVDNLSNKLELDLKILMTRRDLPIETKRQLYELTKKTYVTQRDTKHHSMVNMMLVSISTKALFTETLLSLILAIVQPLWMPYLVMASLGSLASGYTTSIAIVSIVLFPSQTRRRGRLSLVSTPPESGRLITDTY